jgi:hypothetical protein
MLDIETEFLLGYLELGSDDYRARLTEPGVQEICKLPALIKTRLISMHYCSLAGLATESRTSGFSGSSES